MGGSTKTTQTQKSTYTPNSTAMSAYESLFPQAQQIASTAWNPATAMQVASFAPQQTQAFNQIGNLQGGYQPYLNQATGYTQNAAAPISASAIQGYMNPYQQDVINATMAQLGQQQGQQVQELNAKAIGQNALGGNRADLARGYLQGQQNLATGSTLAGLNQSNYQQALAAAQGDAARRLSAGQQMAGLGQLGQTLGLEGSQALYGAGTAQQTQQQNELNATSQNAQSQTMWPYQNLQWLSSILSGVGPLMGGTTTGSGTTTQKENMGIGSMIGAGLSALTLLSDERAKEDIEAIGKTFDGQNIYKFKYKGHPQTHIGMLAQEVQGEHPEAVGNIGGLKTVDYDQATEAAAKRKHFADGGSVFGGESYFPWATLEPAQSIVPQIPASGIASGGGKGQSKSDLSSLGQQARKGLGSLFRMLSDGDEASPPASGAKSFSGIGSLFGMANGGVPRMAFAGGGPVDFAAFDDSDTSRKDPGFLSNLWRDATDLGNLPIFNAWGTPAPENFPEAPDDRKTALQVTPRSDRLTPDVLRLLPRTAPREDSKVSPLGDVRSISAVGELGGTSEGARAAPQSDLSAIPTISSVLETGSRNPLVGIGFINKRDTGGSHSYGNFGINSGGSAQQFQKEYGAQLGLSGRPGTPEFDQQWVAAARKNPEALRAAEMDWHRKTIGGAVVGGLQKAGLPAPIAADPRVQAYFSDRAVQYGPAATERHADRIQFAYQTSGDDPEKFLQAMTTIDRGGLTHDFRTYLKENPSHIKGLTNRVNNRLTESLGIGGGQPAQNGATSPAMPTPPMPMRSPVPPVAGPTALASNQMLPPSVPPQVMGDMNRSSIGTAGEPQTSASRPSVPGISMAGPAIAPSQPQAAMGAMGAPVMPANLGGVGAATQPATATPAQSADKKSQFGMLSGIGLDINPLNWTDEQRERYLRLGLGMWGNNMRPGQGGLEGIGAADRLSAQTQEHMLKTKEMEELGRQRAAQLAMQEREFDMKAKESEGLDRYRAGQLEIARMKAERGTGGTREKKQFTPIGRDALGQPIYGFVDPATGEVTPYQGAKQETGAPSADATLTGEAFLQSLDKNTASQVKALTEGRMAFPSGTALKTPYWQNMIRAVSQYDPNFDAINYNSRVNTRKDFTSGKSAQNVSSFNTAIGHLSTLYDAANDLDNTRFSSWNAIKNTAKSQYDEKTQRALKKFDTARIAVTDELTRAFRGTGGNVHDILQWEKALNSSDSPAATKAAIRQAIELLSGRIESVSEQYNRGMGTTKDPLELLNERSKAALARMAVDRKESSGTRPPIASPTSATSAAPSAPSGKDRPSISSKSQYDALPSGSEYIDARTGATKRKK